MHVRTRPDSDDVSATGQAPDASPVAAAYRLHYGAVAAYVLRRTGSVDATEDIVAETFLVATRKPRRCAEPAAARHWLLRVATLQTNAWVRRRRLAGGWPVADLPAPDAARVGEALEALRDLAIHEQEVLSLKYLADLSIEDIARVLRCRRGTVKSRLSRARDALRRRLGRRET